MLLVMAARKTPGIPPAVCTAPTTMRKAVLNLLDMSLALRERRKQFMSQLRIS
jgi:hypothetical protein